MPMTGRISPCVFCVGLWKGFEKVHGENQIRPLSVHENLSGGGTGRGMGMSKIFDNIGNKFESGLKAILANIGVKRADFCVGYFNLRGWGQIAGEIEALPGDDAIELGSKGIPHSVHRICRLLIGMHRPPQDVIGEMYDIEKHPVDSDAAKNWRRKVALDFRRQLTLGVPTSADEKALQTLRSQLDGGKVCVKLHLRHPLHAKLYMAYRPQDTSNPIMSIMGSSNLTLSGLVRNGELNAEFGDFDDNRKYAKWFEDRWNDNYSIDITKDLIDVLDGSWASISGPLPYEVYLKIMFHLSREARSGVSEYRLPPPFDTELFDFQKTAVKLAVRHLEKRGGAMIGDVVGLGKTITACAVAKFYEETLGASTLVLCPPNLREMWRGYANKYDLKMAVRSIAEKFDPRKERYFRLVIIDESHNLRNGEGQRYAMIKDLLDYQENKVLLLTATPYNKDFSDLSSQLRLFVDPDLDLGIRPECQILADGGEQAFALKYGGDMPISSLRAFEKSCSADDWRDLMKLYLVRRTRTFIKKHYAKTDDATGRKYLEMKDGTRNYFPDRIPKAVKFKTSPGDMFERMYCKQMIDWMGELKLPRYGLLNYIDPAKENSATGKEKQILENLSRAGRRMKGFCRTGFLKRMDSSGISFLASLYRHAVRNEMFLYAIKNKLDLPLRSDAELGSGLDESEDGGIITFSITTATSDYESAGKAAYEQLASKNPSSVKWISPAFFKRSLARALKGDNEIILKMLNHCGEWRPADDEKLGELVKIVSQQHGKEKVLVFTQYSDTAKYIAGQLSARRISGVEQVDGNTENVIDVVNRFSPVSNHQQPMPDESQTRILVATDMLSEGQNLQDAHIVVNYDLPWAIIRLIQRAGRVDRIGQKAPEVFCYSFFPQEGIETLMELRERLNARINENAEAVGSDEIFFEGNRQNLADIFNEKAGVLDEVDDGEVDMASQAYQIWMEATKGKPELAAKIQNMADVVYSTKTAVAAPTSVITYSKTKNDGDALVWLDSNGEVVSQSPGRIFEALECYADTPKLSPLANHHELVAKALASVKSAHSSVVGMLGPKSSTRFRIFAILQNRLKEDALPLFEQNLKAAADQIYSYPMKETAKNTLGKMLRHMSAEDIIQSVLEFYRDGELCQTPDGEDAAPRSARIICSMGLSTEALQ